MEISFVSLLFIMRVNVLSIKEVFSVITGGAEWSPPEVTKSPLLGATGRKVAFWPKYPGRSFIFCYISVWPFENSRSQVTKINDPGRKVAWKTAQVARSLLPLWSHITQVRFWEDWYFIPKCNLHVANLRGKVLTLGAAFPTNMNYQDPKPAKFQHGISVHQFMAVSHEFVTIEASLTGCRLWPGVVFDQQVSKGPRGGLCRQKWGEKVNGYFNTIYSKFPGISVCIAPL